MAKMERAATIQKVGEAIANNEAVNKLLTEAMKELLAKNKYTIVVVNATKEDMERVGSYNDSKKWPISDVAANTIEHEVLDVTSFSFAAKYVFRTNDDDENDEDDEDDEEDDHGNHNSHEVTLTCSSPFVGKDKVAVGTGSPKNVWDKMLDGNDSVVYFGNVGNDVTMYRCRGFIKSSGSSSVWIFKIDYHKKKMIIYICK